MCIHSVKVSSCWSYQVTITQPKEISDDNVSVTDLPHQVLMKARDQRVRHLCKKVVLVVLYSQTRLSGEYWNLIMSIHLSVTPCGLGGVVE